MVGWKIKLVATIATEASKAGKKAIVHLVSFITHQTAPRGLHTLEHTDKN